jgi:hypothetical protein
MSTAFHPQTDGQSEVVNMVIAMYLRCVTGDRPRSWVDWLSWAEYCYNTSFHTALRAMPFEVVYGRPPLPILPYTPGSSKTETADALPRSRDEMLAEVRQRLLQVQQLSKKYYNASHRALEFFVGDWVWLRLLHRTTQSLDPQVRRKLGLRYAGPFKIVERIGTVVYRLQLPADARVHDVFHVGLLKPHRGDPPAAPAELPALVDGRITSVPKTTLQAQLRRTVWFVRIKWRGLGEEDGTWEKLDEFRAHYPDFQLEDELFAQEGRDVMTGVKQGRRAPRG